MTERNRSRITYTAQGLVKAVVYDTIMEQIEKETIDISNHNNFITIVKFCLLFCNSLGKIDPKNLFNLSIFTH